MGVAVAVQVALDFLAQPGGHGPVEQLVALFVENVQMHAAAPGGEVAQRVDAAVLQRRGGGVQHDRRGGTLVERGLAAALARLVAQPQGAADADRGRHLGQQDGQEKLPEQPAHRYSRISW
ncbi:hypothetical protein ACCD08_24695 [Telluria sp. Tellsp104]